MSPCVGLFLIKLCQIIKQYILTLNDTLQFNELLYFTSIIDQMLSLILEWPPLRDEHKSMIKDHVTYLKPNDPCCYLQYFNDKEVCYIHAVF